MNSRAGVTLIEEPLPKIRSFNSVAQTKNDNGDFSMEAKALSQRSEDEDAQAHVMDKIAIMETALLSMSKKINKLETEKMAEEDQIQLLELKLNEVEQHSHSVPQHAEDHMNLQLDDKIGNLKSSISNMFVRNQDLVQVDSSMRVKALSEIN